MALDPALVKVENAHDRIDALISVIATMKSNISTLQTGQTVLQPLINQGLTWNTWLASLTQMPHLPNDNNTGPNWATGERDFYNNLKAGCVSNNFMS